MLLCNSLQVLPDSIVGEAGTALHFHVLGPKPSSFRRAALAIIFWGARSSTENELPQIEHEPIPARVAHNLRDQVSSGMGDKVPVPRFEGGGCPSGAGTDPSDVSQSGCSNRKGTRWQGSRARTWICAPDPESGRPDEASKRSVVAQATAGICPSEKAILGEALLGTRIFLRDERPGYGRTDSRLHRGTRPGAARFGFHGKGMSFSRLSVVTPFVKPLDFQSRVV